MTHARTSARADVQTAALKLKVCGKTANNPLMIRINADLVLTYGVKRARNSARVNNTAKQSANQLAGILKKCGMNARL